MSFQRRSVKIFALAGLLTTVFGPPMSATNPPAVNPPGSSEAVNLMRSLAFFERNDSQADKTVLYLGKGDGTFDSPLSFFAGS
jgi:hypothetical protein